MLRSRFWLAAAQGRFPPAELVRHAAAAEDAGFDAVLCADAFSRPASAAGTWAGLGAAGQATRHVPVGAAVRLDDAAAAARAADELALVAALFPGRAFLGVEAGPGRLADVLDALRETPGAAPETPVSDWAAPGRPWAPVPQQSDAPRLYVHAARAEDAAQAGRLADGIWITAAHDRVPALVDAYHEGCAAAGKDPGEVVVPARFVWGEDERTSRFARRPVRWDDLGDDVLVSADLDVHVERIRSLQELGATTICLQDVAGADPFGTIRVYGEHVLPALRGAWV